MMHFYKFIMIPALLSLQACNTMEGVGSDIKGAGKALEQSAAEGKHNLHHDCERHSDCPICCKAKKLK